MPTSEQTEKDGLTMSNNMDPNRTTISNCICTLKHTQKAPLITSQQKGYAWQTQPSLSFSPKPWAELVLCICKILGIDI